MKIKQLSVFTGVTYVYPPADTLDYRLNVLNNITKSATNDSTLISTDPSKEFKMGSEGTKNFYDQPCGTCDKDRYKIRFRNDSIYIYLDYDDISAHPSVTSYYTTFNGKKQ